LRPIELRDGIVLSDPLRVALDFLEAYGTPELSESRATAPFGEADLRLANRGGARIAAVEFAAILERRSEVENALRAIPIDASLAAPARLVPWLPLTRLFDAFADIRGVGLAKVTKALHPRRPALIPMLDSFVQAYLSGIDRRGSPSFAEQAVALVRGFKDDLDRNRGGLHELRRELERRGYRITEVRILDILIWSTAAGEY
jgi:hypothetical protein